MLYKRVKRRKAHRADAEQNVERNITTRTRKISIMYSIMLLR